MGLISLLVDGVMTARKHSIKNNAKNNLETETVSYQNRFAIDIPTFLKPTNKLSDDASIQYRNTTLDIGVLVIDEPKSEFIDEWEEIKSYLDDDDNPCETLVDKVMSASLFNMFNGEDVELSNVQEKHINGMPAVSVEVSKPSTFFKDASYTHITCIEGRNTIYQIIAIVGGSSIPEFSSRLSTIASTFKEL